MSTRDYMYCDYGATAPLPQDVINQVVSTMHVFGNPSSTYSLGDEARKIVANCRETVKKFINAPEDSRVIFTPSGSASNTLAVRGYIQSHLTNNYFSPLLHKSINNYIKEELKDYELINVNTKGFIDLNSFQQRLEMNHQLEPFVVIEFANSEIGTLQLVKDVTRLTHQYNGKVYVDCTGAVASIPIDVQNLEVDMIGFSGHKLGALKGIGVLWLKNSNTILKPLIYGAQEEGLVGGTENVLGIVSLNAAIKFHKYYKFTDDFRLELYKRIVKNGWKLIGSRKRRLPNNFFFSIPNHSGEEIVTRLDLRYNIQASTGSACNSGSKEYSSALKAINLPEELMNSCVRLTFHGDEKENDVRRVFRAIETLTR